MNQLSLLLYLGGVVSNLGQLLAVIGFLTLIIAAVCIVMSFVYETYHESYEEDQAVKGRFRSYGICLIILASIVGLLATLCPSQETMYAIAASQVGEQVIKTPLAGKAEKALESWLDKQITKTPTN